MRINELLVFPDAEIILESYRDFSRLWDEMLHEVQYSAELTRDMSDLKNVPYVLEKILRDNRLRGIMSDDPNILKLVKSTTEVKNPLDASSWVAALRDMKRFMGTLHAVQTFGGSIYWLREDIDKEIKNRTPDYDMVKKTPEYIIFDAKNFAAARKLRNQVGAKWCIGADDDQFKYYGTDRGRKTYIIFFLKKKEGMVFHLGKGVEGLITSYDNQRDWIIRGKEALPNRGYTELVEELSTYLDMDGVERLMSDMGLYIKGMREKIVTYDAKQDIDKFIRILDKKAMHPATMMFSKTPIREMVINRVKRNANEYSKSMDIKPFLLDLESISKTLFGLIDNRLNNLTQMQDALSTLAIILQFIRDSQEKLVDGKMVRQVISVNSELSNLLMYGSKDINEMKSTGRSIRGQFMKLIRDLITSI